MRILTVFYSLEGNCRALAEIIRQAVGGDVEALRPDKEIPRQGFWRFLIGGKVALFGQSCPNQPLTVNIAGYDLISSARRYGRGA
jgi:flavodoxin